MSSIYDSRQRWKLGFIFAAVLIAMASVVVSDLLIKDLAREERQKIEVWSEATRVMTSENPSLNMNLILKIIQGNTSIPVILCSETDSVVSYNNIEIPEKNVAQFMTNKVKELRTKNPPIVIDMEDGTYQYLYYDDSIILKRLLVYPKATRMDSTIFVGTGSGSEPILEKRSAIVCKRFTSLSISVNREGSISFVRKYSIQAISEDIGVPNW